MKGKRLGFILTLVLIMALAVPAWAADTKIDSVKLISRMQGQNQSPAMRSAEFT